MMKAVHTSETSVYFNETTLRCVPEGYHLHTCRLENMKSHVENAVFRNFGRPVFGVTYRRKRKLYIVLQRGKP
jgi:hypothetical protein